jgi:exopolysaccharide production protein ExoY
MACADHLTSQQSAILGGALPEGQLNVIWQWAMLLPSGAGRVPTRSSQFALSEARSAERAQEHREEPVGGLAKRILDIIVSATALILLSPLMLIVAILVRTTMGSPVVFRQRRVGSNRTTFVCYKFRTMVVDGDRVLREHLAQDPAAAREWRETRKLQADPRVSCLGHLLRKSSLDELPQLFNVLKGDMSCVGPRPLVEEELANYGQYGRECFRAKPGLTGLWQVSGRSRCSYSRRIALDRVYVRRWSVLLDLAVLVKTVPAIFKFDEAA